MNADKMLILKRLGILILAMCLLSFGLVALLRIFTGQLGSMVFALVIGGFGATVSLARRVPSLDDKKLASLAASWWNLAIPILIGVIMGGLLYVVFFAGILTGDGGRGLFTSNLFPNFTSPPTDQSRLLNMKEVLEIRPSSIQDLGKLLVWCFLAGFSEKLVPNLLKNLESKVDEGGAST